MNKKIYLTQATAPEDFSHLLGFTLAEVTTAAGDALLFHFENNEGVAVDMAVDTENKTIHISTPFAMD